MWKDKLEEIRNDELQYNEKLNTGISISELSFIEAKLDLLGSKNFTKSFVKFLLETNGLDYNGYVVYGVIHSDYPCDEEIYDIFECNEIWHENENFKRYIFWGESGLSWYVYDKISQKYLELDNPSSRFLGEYDSFEKLLEKELKESLE